MMTMVSRLTLSNRKENLDLLLDFIRKWAKDLRVPPSRRSNLELAAEEIFRHLVTHAYRPGQPGSIAITLEEKGPRLRLTFEDDAASRTSSSLKLRRGKDAPDPLGHGPHLNGVLQVAESIVYYRTADRKNRLVVFIS
jgi:anti-sigma regulatory factor (Ser/Thr protein kinase)